MKHKQNLRKFILLIGSFFLMCSKKSNEDSNNYPHLNPDTSIIMDAPTIKKVSNDTTHNVNAFPIIKKDKRNDSIVNDTNVISQNSFKEIKKPEGYEKTDKFVLIKKASDSLKYQGKSIQKRENISSRENIISHKIKKIKDTVINNAVIKVMKDTFPCSISFPDFYTSHERPATITEAKDLSQFFWQKALCYKSINIDSCFLYTQKAIKTYENGSLFTLKAYCLYKLNMFSASKTATEISLSRNDHWNLNDTKIALSIKIQVLDTINKTQPSFEIKSELEKSQNEYKNLYSNN